MWNKVLLLGWYLHVYERVYVLLLLCTCLDDLTFSVIRFTWVERKEREKCAKQSLNTKQEII